MAMYFIEMKDDAGGTWLVAYSGPQSGIRRCARKAVHAWVKSRDWGDRTGYVKARYDLLAEPEAGIHTAGRWLRSSGGRKRCA